MTTAIIRAIRLDDVIAMKTAMLGAKLNANSELAGGYNTRDHTVFTYTIFSGSRNCFEHLLNNGGDPNARSKTGYTALAHSLRDPMTFLRRILRSNDVDVTTKDMHRCMKEKYSDEEAHVVLHGILNHQSYVPDDDPESTNFLAAMMRKANPEIVALYLTKGYVYRVSDLVDAAVLAKSDAIMRILLEKCDDTELLKVAERCVDSRRDAMLVEVLKRKPVITEGMIKNAIGYALTDYRGESGLRLLSILLTVLGKGYFIDLTPHVKDQQSNDHLYSVLQTIYRHGCLREDNLGAIIPVVKQEYEYYVRYSVNQMIAVIRFLLCDHRGYDITALTKQFHAMLDSLQRVDRGARRERGGRGVEYDDLYQIFGDLLVDRVATAANPAKKKELVQLAFDYVKRYPKLASYTLLEPYIGTV